MNGSTQTPDRTSSDDLNCIRISRIAYITMMTIAVITTTRLITTALTTEPRRIKLKTQLTTPATLKMTNWQSK